MLDNRELKPLPEPESFDQKEVFAFFGLAVFYAQVLELGVLNLVVALWTSLGVTREMMDAELHQMLAEVEDRKRSG